MKYVLRILERNEDFRPYTNNFEMPSRLRSVSVATPLWAKWENATPTPKMWRLGVLRDSRKLRRQFEGSNLLALMCSLYQ